MENAYQTLKENSSKLKELFFKHSFDKISLIIYCVDKSTIRSFHSSKGYVKKYKPLSIFRVWAYNQLSDFEFINKIKSKENFVEIRDIALKNLMDFWFFTDNGNPEFYQFNKLIDLFFKCLPLWNELEQETKEWIFFNTNVPLDKFSLDLLRRWNDGLGITKNVSMNYIKEDNYEMLQIEIKKICKDLPCIIFDLYAWDENHKPIEKFELIELEMIK
jgi:hypothetical protein